MISKHKITVLFFIIVAIVLTQSFTNNKHDEDEKPINLKILPKDISGDELHQVMRAYSKALGVRCSYCHEKKEGQQHADFASDAKKEKEIAREMMLMVNDINTKYLANSGKGHFEKISCVTCHMGRKVPIISVDSLPKNPNERDPKKIPLHQNDTIKFPKK
ncbi:MAG TPA: c-type cytochrome [Bacteroidia bacterium]|nr:c-type cytochrome [Bacteroidia bacterium]